MELNPEIKDVLKEHRIDVDSGTLVLLGIYFKLDVDTIVPEEVVQAINLTKIVEKDFKANNSLVWNIPLFKGQETAFGWVFEWVDGFGKINPDRRGSPRDAITRMKDFFSKYPEFRKEDVFLARDNYFKSVRDSKYLMKSHKFIFDGAGAMKKSELLAWCEKLKLNTGFAGHQRGQIVT